MNDSLVNESTLSATSDDGQSQRASAEQSQSSNGGQTSQDGGQSAKEKNNVAALQSKLDKQIADLRKQLEAKEEQLHQYMQNFQHLQRRLEEMEDAAAPDDYVRMENKARRAEQRAAALEAQLAHLLQQQEQANKRQTALNNIAAKYGVDVDALQKAEDYDEAIELAIELRNQKRRQEQELKEERRQANRPDIGGGRLSTSIERIDEELKAAKERRDSPAIIRLQRLRREAEAAATKK